MQCIPIVLNNFTTTDYNLCNNLINKTTSSKTPLMKSALIPTLWNHKILTPAGRPDKNTISLIAEVAYWFRKKLIKNKATGEITYASKFKGDLWQTSYSYLEDKFNLSHETIRRCFVKLENLGLVLREHRTVTSYGQKYYNCLFVKLNLEHPLLKIFNFTGSTEQVIGNDSPKAADFFTPKNVETSPQKVGDIYKNKEIKDIDNLDSVNTKIKIAETEKSKLSKSFSLKNNKEEIKESRVVNAPIATSPAAIEKITPKPTTQVKIPVLLKAPNPIKLPDMSSITEEEARILQSQSGRDFSLNLMNELLQKLKRIKATYSFPSRFVFLNYFAKVLKYEMRDATATSNIFYRLKDNIKAEEEAAANGENSSLNDKSNKLNELRKMEIYLSSVETSKDNSRQSQLMRKITGGFNADIAYGLLTSLVSCEQISNTAVKLIFSDRLETSNSHQRKLLELVKSVYGSNIYDLITELKEPAVKSEMSAAIQLQASKEKEDIINNINNKSAWGRVRNKLLESYGINLDKHWFSKLTAVEDAKTKQLSLKAPSNFVREWINANYFSCIKRACIDYGWSLEEMISV